MNFLSRLTFAALLALMTPYLSARAEAPRVVASIAPVHALVASVMAGVEEPRLLVQGFASPHTYQLRPSDAAELAGADLIVWIGPGLETALARPLLALGEQAEILAFGQHESLALLPVRNGGIWRDSSSEKNDNDHAVVPGIADQHVWLSPENAVSMVHLIAEALGRIDGDNDAVYRTNADQTARMIREMTDEIEQQLAPVRETPYLVLHDAFQYFERYFGLNAIGAVSLGPDRLPGARRFRNLRAEIQTLGVTCAFVEPQIASTLFDTLLQDTAVRRGVLDPLGASFAPGPNAYFDMMRSNAGALTACLGPSS